LPGGTRFAIAFPLARSKAVGQATLLENLRAQGFLRVALDGDVRHLDDFSPEGNALLRARELLVIADRLAVGPDASGRVAEALGTAFREGDGECVVLLSSPVVTGSGGDPVDRLRFTERFE